MFHSFSNIDLYSKRAGLSYLASSDDVLLTGVLNLLAMDTFANMGPKQIFLLPKHLLITRPSKPKPGNPPRLVLDDGGCSTRNCKACQKK